jgi:NAD binding domain of 6-phosphogluconate dehydrogenase
MSLSRIGFIGSSGLMGHGMTKHLLLKGFTVTMLARPNRPRERFADLLAGGAKEAATAGAVAKNSDVVILCITGAPEVDACVYGEEGILAASRPGMIVMDSSTNELEASTRARKEFAAKGVAFVDAPLTRTPAAAEEGKLNTMVGADEATFKALEPVLKAYCENIIYAGPPGHGLILKLINNFVGQACAHCPCHSAASPPRSSRFAPRSLAGHLHGHCRGPDHGRKDWARHSRALQAHEPRVCEQPHVPVHGRQDARGRAAAARRPQVLALQRNEGCECRLFIISRRQ